MSFGSSHCGVARSSLSFWALAVLSVSTVVSTAIVGVRFVQARHRQLYNAGTTKIDSASSGACTTSQKVIEELKLFWSFWSRAAVEFIEIELMERSAENTDVTVRSGSGIYQEDSSSLREQAALRSASGLEYFSDSHLAALRSGTLGPCATGAYRSSSESSNNIFLRLLKWKWRVSLDGLWSTTTEIKDIVRFDLKSILFRRKIGPKPKFRRSSMAGDESATASPKVTPALVSVSGITDELSSIFASLIPVLGRSPMVIVLRAETREETFDFSAYAQDVWEQVQLDSSASENDLFDILCVTERIAPVGDSTSCAEVKPRLCVEVYPARMLYLTLYSSLLLQEKNNAILSAVGETNFSCMRNLFDPAVPDTSSPRCCGPMSPPSSSSPCAVSSTSLPSPLGIFSPTRLSQNSFKSARRVEKCFFNFLESPGSPEGTAGSESADLVWKASTDTSSPNKGTDGREKSQRGPQVGRGSTSTGRISSIPLFQEKPTSQVPAAGATTPKRGLRVAVETTECDSERVVYPAVCLQSTWESFYRSERTQKAQECADRLLSNIREEMNITIKKLREKRTTPTPANTTAPQGHRYSDDLRLLAELGLIERQQRRDRVILRCKEYSFTAAVISLPDNRIFRVVPRIVPRISVACARSVAIYGTFAEEALRQQSFLSFAVSQKVKGSLATPSTSCGIVRSAFYRTTRIVLNTLNQSLCGGIDLPEPRPVREVDEEAKERVCESLFSSARLPASEIVSSVAEDHEESLESVFLFSEDEASSRNQSNAPLQTSGARRLSASLQRRCAPLENGGGEPLEMGKSTDSGQQPPSDTCPSFDQKNVTLASVQHNKSPTSSLTSAHGCTRNEEDGDVNVPFSRRKTSVLNSGSFATSPVLSFGEVALRLRADFGYLSLERNFEYLMSCSSQLQQNFFNSSRGLFYIFTHSSAQLFNASIVKSEDEDRWLVSKPQVGSALIHLNGTAEGPLQTAEIFLPSFGSRFETNQSSGDWSAIRNTFPSSNSSIADAVEETVDVCVERMKSIRDERNKSILSVMQYLHGHFFATLTKPASYVSPPSLSSVAPNTPMKERVNRNVGHRGGCTNTDDPIRTVQQCFGGFSIRSESVDKSNGQYGITPLDVWLACRYSQQISGEVYIMDVMASRGDPYITSIRVVDEVVSHAVLVFHNKSLLDFVRDLHTHFQLNYCPQTKWGHRCLGSLSWVPSKHPEGLNTKEDDFCRSWEEKCPKNVENHWDASIEAHSVKNFPSDDDERRLQEEIEHLKQFLINNRNTLFSAVLTPAKANRLESIFGVPSTVFPFLLCQRESVPLVHRIYHCLVQYYGELTYPHFYQFIADVFVADRPEVVRHTPRIFRTLNRSRSGCISFEELCGWLARKLSCGTQKNPDAHLISVLMSLRLPMALVVDQKPLWMHRKFATSAAADGDEFY